MSRWVAAIVRDGLEITLASELLGIAHDTYCPVYKRWRKLPKHIARKLGKTRELITESLIPGYLFVSVSGPEQLAAVYKNKDVFDFVKTSTGVCYARDTDIQALRENEMSRKAGASTKRLADKAKEELQQQLASLVMADYRGKTVKLTAGPLQGRFGVVNDGDEQSGELKLVVEGWDVTAKVAQLELV